MNRPFIDPGKHPFGLCDRCEHQKIMTTPRGSVFTLCRLNFKNPLYPKYPAVPVRECSGFRERPAP